MSHAESPPPSPPSQSAPTSSATSAPPATASANQRPPRLALFIATGFGLGYLPKAPGTWGSLAATLFSAIAGVGLAFFWLDPEFYFPMGVHVLDRFLYFDKLSFFVITALVSSVGVWASQRSSEHFPNTDPQFVVVDEISGQLLTFAVCPFDWQLFQAASISRGNWFSGWQYLLAGFILFRVFDIWKPWPVRQAEKLPGGWGIMADDWVAGIYAALCLWGLRSLGL